MKIIFRSCSIFYLFDITNRINSIQLKIYIKIFPVKLFRSKSSKNNTDHNSKDDDDSEHHTKVKRSRSVFFDPTTQVNHTFPDLIWKMTFRRLPEAPKLNATTLTSDQVMDLLHCGLLSNAVYLKSSKRHLPPNLSNTVIECNVSDFYRVPYFVVDSDELDTIFIAFRGSACLKDWHVDFLAAAIQFERGHVHEGVYFTALNIFNDFKDQIRDLSKLHNNRKIITTGHSLGGAVAGMMAVLFNEEMVDLNVRGVCLAPVACLSPEIWEISHSYIQSYINYGDLVPFISYYNTFHLPENCLPKIPYDQLMHWCMKKTNKHSKRPEFRLLVETYTEPVSEPYKLIPPGVSYLIRVVDKKAARIDMQSIDDQQDYFGQFVKNLSAMKHPIKLYKHSIIRYFCQFFNQDDTLITYYNLSKRKTRRRHHRRYQNKHSQKNENENDFNYDNEKGSGNRDESSNDDENDFNLKDDDNGNNNDDYSSDDDNNNYNYNNNDDDDDDESSNDDDDNNYNYNNNDDDGVETSNDNKKDESSDDLEENYYVVE